MGSLKMPSIVLPTVFSLSSSELFTQKRKSWELVFWPKSNSMRIKNAARFRYIDKWVFFHMDGGNAFYLQLHYQYCTWAHRVWESPIKNKKFWVNNGHSINVFRLLCIWSTGTFVIKRTLTLPKYVDYQNAEEGEVPPMLVFTTYVTK